MECGQHGNLLSMMTKSFRSWSRLRRKLSWLHKCRERYRCFRRWLERSRTRRNPTSSRQQLSRQVKCCRSGAGVLGRKRARELHRSKPADSEVQSQVNKDGQPHLAEASFSKKAAKKKVKRLRVLTQKKAHQKSRSWASPPAWMREDGRLMTSTFLSQVSGHNTQRSTTEHWVRKGKLATTATENCCTNWMQLPAIKSELCEQLATGFSVSSEWFLWRSHSHAHGFPWLFTTTRILPVVFVLLTLERNEVIRSLSNASSRCATLACSHCMRSWPRAGTSRQALVQSKFILHSTSTFMVMDCQDSPRILPPRWAWTWAPRKSVYVWIPVTLPEPRPVRKRLLSSAHVFKASYVEAIHKLNKHLRPFRWWDASCPSQKSLFPLGFLVVSDRLLEPQVLNLDMLCLAQPRYAYC